MEEAVDGGVDVGAVGEDVVERRAGEGGAEFLLGHVAEGVVVAVEEPVEVGVEGLVGGDELAEDEGLEEPAGVGEVPFDGAGLGTGLDHEVFGRERGGEREGGRADGAVAVMESGGCAAKGPAWGLDLHVAGLLTSGSAFSMRASCPRLQMHQYALSGQFWRSRNPAATTPTHRD